MKNRLKDVLAIVLIITTVCGATLTAFASGETDASELVETVDTVSGDMTEEETEELIPAAEEVTEENAAEETVIEGEIALPASYPEEQPQETPAEEVTATVTEEETVAEETEAEATEETEVTKEDEEEILPEEAEVKEDDDEVTVSGIFYTLNKESMTATVTGGDMAVLGSSVSIPAQITTEAGNTYRVTAVGDYAFYDEASLQRISMAEGITEIGKAAFCKTNATGTLVIPDSVQSIGNSAFSMAQFEKIVLGKGLRYIDQAFLYNSTDFEVELHCNSLQEANRYVFYVNNGVKITSVTVYGENASDLLEQFPQLKNAEQVITPESETDAEEEEKGPLTYEYHEDGTATVTGGDVSETDGVLEIPATVTKGGKEYRVTTVADHAFRDRTGIDTLILHEGLERIGQVAFYNLPATGTLVIPDSVTKIGQWAFANHSFDKVVLGNGLTTPNAVEPYAFAYGNVKEVVASPDVYRFPEMSFFKNNCTIDRVIFEGADTETVVYSFGGNRVNEVIFRTTPTRSSLLSALYHLCGVSASKDGYEANSAAKGEVIRLEETGEVITARDGLVYDIASGEAKLIALIATYDDTIEVPAQIYVNGTAYPVTEIGSALVSHPYSSLSNSYVSLSVIVDPEADIPTVAEDAFAGLRVGAFTCDENSAVYEVLRRQFPDADFTNNGTDKSTVEEGGVVFKLADGKAAVVALRELEDETIMIPASVTVDGKDYPVTAIDNALKANPLSTFTGDTVSLVIAPDAKIDAVSFAAFEGLNVISRTHNVKDTELLRDLMYMLPDADYINNAPGVTIATDAGNTYLIENGAATLVAIAEEEGTVTVAPEVNGAPVTAIGARIVRHPFSTAVSGSVKTLVIDPDAPIDFVDLTAFRTKDEASETYMSDGERRSFVLPVEDVYCNRYNTYLTARIKELLPDAAIHHNGEEGETHDADWLQEQVNAGGTVAIDRNVVIDHTVIIPAGVDVTFVGAKEDIADLMQALSVRTMEATRSAALNEAVLIESSEELEGAMFEVNGTLHIADEHITLQREEGVVLDVNGTLDLANGTIIGGRQAAAQSGAVKVNGTFTMSGGLITGTNVVSNGDLVEKGTVYVGDGASFTMTGGRIAGNKSDDLHEQVSSGVYVHNGVFTLAGGELSENQGGRLGGAATISGEGASFTMTGGIVRDNSAKNGAGIAIHSNAALRMSGGTITNNRTTENSPGNYGYGGGLFIHSNNAQITGGNITGNHADVAGGGLYVANETCEVFLQDVLITGNRATGVNTLTASGAGGGLWSCPTGTARVHAQNGAAIFDNRADLVGADVASFSQNGRTSYLESKMLGGGQVTYYHDGTVLSGAAADARVLFGASFGTVASAERYNGSGTPVPVNTTLSTAFAAKAVASSADKANATALAAVVISGNDAARGGGIGTNGSVIFGSAADTTLTAYKTLNNEAPGAERFTFILEDKDHNELQRVLNDDSGLVEFAGTNFHYTQAGTYVYYVRELKEDAYKIIYDETIYRVEITVTRDGDDIRASAKYFMEADGEETEVAQIAFHNTKEDPDVTPAHVRFTAVKYLNGAAPNRTFTFALVDGTGAARQTKRNNGSAITFDEIVFEEEGTYRFVLREVAGSERYVTYDNTTYIATVTVTGEKDERGDITLKAAVTWEKDGEGYTGAEPVFNNSYNPPETPPRETPPGNPPTIPPTTPPTPAEPPQVLGVRRTGAEAVLGARRGITGETRRHGATTLVAAAMFGLVNLMMMKKKKAY